MYVPSPVMPNSFRHLHRIKKLKVANVITIVYITKNYRIIRMKNSYIYIMSNKYRTTFYIGVTNNLERRIWEHNNGSGSMFVQKYNLFDLVYYEHFLDIRYAIMREKQLKNWHREWKINLIKKNKSRFR